MQQQAAIQHSAARTHESQTQSQRLMFESPSSAESRQAEHLAIAGADTAQGKEKRVHDR